MLSSSLIIERNHNVCSLILNRTAEHNAFDDVLIADLSQALTDINHDPSIRVVLLRANGKHFSAGADLHWMKRMVKYDAQQNLDDSMHLANLLKQLAQLKQTTIALVQGSSYGGGVGLVAACDIAIASPNATFCLSEVKLGLIPAVISPYVIAAIGERQARRYFMTAEQFDAQTALQYQLIHEICHDDLLTRAYQLTQVICRNGPQAVMAAKQLIADVARRPLDDALVTDTAERIAQIRISPEGQEGLSAFLEKRRANWLPDQGI